MTKETQGGPPEVFQIGYAEVDQCYDEFSTTIIGYIDTVNLHQHFLLGVTEKEAPKPEDRATVIYGPYFHVLGEFSKAERASPEGDYVPIGYATVDDRDEDRPRIDLYIDSPGLARPLHAWITPDHPKGPELWEGERSRFRFWREMPIYWRRLPPGQDA